MIERIYETPIAKVRPDENIIERYDLGDPTVFFFKLGIDPTIHIIYSTFLYVLLVFEFDRKSHFMNFN